MPTNGTAISSIYTLRDIINRITSRMTTPEPEKERLLPTIIAEINTQQKAMAKKLREEKPDVRDLYIHKYTIAGAWSEKGFVELEASAPAIVEVDRMEAYLTATVKWGIVPYQPPRAFNSLHGIVYFDNSLMYTVEQKRLKLHIGQNLDATGMTFYVYCVRQANTLSAMGDYMDLPDTALDELANLVILQLSPNKAEENR